MVKNQSSHIASIFFLAFLLLPLVSLLVLQSTQWCLSVTAGSRLESHKQETISLPVNSVVWQKKEKELNVQERLFDVKEYSLANGILTATGYFDDEETSIVHLLSRFATPETKKALLQLVLVFQCFATGFLVFLFWQTNSRLIHRSFYSLFLTAPAGLMAERPPQQ